MMKMQLCITGINYILQNVIIFHNITVSTVFDHINAALVSINI